MTRIFAIACAALFLIALPAPAFASIVNDDPAAPFAVGAVDLDLPPIFPGDALPPVFPPVDPPVVPPDPAPVVPADPPPGLPADPSAQVPTADPSGSTSAVPPDRPGGYSGRGAITSSGPKRTDPGPFPAPTPLLTPTPGQDLTFTPVPSPGKAPGVRSAASTRGYAEDPASTAATWFVIVFAALGIGVVAGSSIVRRVRYR